MNFQTLQKVHDSDHYLDVAFKGAKRAVEKLKVNGDRLRKTTVIESERIKYASKILHGELERITREFPRIDELPEFYRELVRCCTDHNQLKKSLGAVGWADKQAQRIFRLHYSNIRHSKEAKTALAHKKAYYGRVSSTVKQIRKELEAIETARKIMKRFPTIKTGLRTVAIAGFPNVGKTTLLKAITGSEPEIAPYPFTTQGLMIGYKEKDGQKIQFIDTPGLLDRPLEKRNRIEKQSILALKYLAQHIIFLIDPTETCGYGIEEQVSLLSEISKNFTVPLTVAVCKQDIAEKDATGRARRMLKNHLAINVSAETGKGIEELIEVST